LTLASVPVPLLDSTTQVCWKRAQAASETPWTSKLWIYDLRTNQHFTLKRNTLNSQVLRDFVTFYNAENRQDRD